MKKRLDKFMRFSLLVLALAQIQMQTQIQKGFCAQETPVPKSQAWEEWVSSQIAESDLPIVQNQQVSKAEKFQVIAPLLGISDRKDLYTTYVVTLAGRYHFTENHGWEFLRLNFTFPNAAGINHEIQEKTNYRPDVQLSRFQLSSSYVYSPVYGKYAWSSNSLVYFDVFGTIGGGVRFADNRQPYVETGLGMNHYLFSRKFALVPEYRLRVYGEQRTQSALVFESMFQLGGSWLF